MQVETLFTGFANREEAGRRLARELRRYRHKPDTVVLGVPRGGVITAAAVAEDLDLPLEVAWTRKADAPLGVANKTAIVVDDGVATGSTMAAAVDAVRAQGAARIVLAVPVAPEETCRAFQDKVEEVVYLETPDPFGAIGYWYTDFPQISDADVSEALERARSLQPV